MRRVGSLVAFVCGALLMLSALLALTLDLFSVDSSVDLVDCHVPTSDSDYGYSTWSWLPPGKVCHYPNDSTARPHWRGELVALVAVSLGAGLVVYAFRRFDDLPSREPELTG